MSKILVTGATGFVGRHLVPHLMREGHQLVCAVSTLKKNLDVPQLIIGKLEDYGDWTEALAGVDVIIHLAGRAHIMMETAKSPIEEYTKVNTFGTENLALQAARLGVKQFIYLSTIKVNGEFSKNLPFTEESPVNATDPYGLSKLNAEKALLEIAANSSMEVVILRPPLIYGPYVKANFLKMLAWVHQKVPLPLGRINNKRNLLYIENLISALTKVIRNPQAANQIFLVADDEGLSLSQMLRELASGMNIKSRFFSVPTLLLKSLFKLLGKSSWSDRLLSSLEIDNHKIKTSLDWKPPFSAMEGLRQTAKWYQREHKN